MKNGRVILAIALLGVLLLAGFLGARPAKGTFVLDTREVSQGGTLAGLVALGQSGDIRPMDQRVPTDVRVVETGENVRAEIAVEAEGGVELEIEYYIMDIGAERLRGDWTRVVADGRKELVVALRAPETPGKYIFHVTVRDGEGISTDMDVFTIP